MNGRWIETKKKAIDIAYEAARFGVLNKDNYDDIDLEELNTQGQYPHEVRMNDPDNCIIGKFDVLLFINIPFW